MTDLERQYKECQLKALDQCLHPRAFAKGWISKEYTCEEWIDKYKRRVEILKELGYSADYRPWNNPGEE